MTTSPEQALAPAGSATGAGTVLPSATSSTFGRLVRFAVANISRRPERFVLATLGIALAIMSVTVVRTISASFAITGSATVTQAVDGASLWVVPAQGVHYDSGADAIVSDGPAPALDLPSGWTGHQTIAGIWRSPQGKVAIHGLDAAPAGTATLGSAVAATLKVDDGDTLSFGGSDLTVRVRGSGSVMTVPTALARDVVGDSGWWTVNEPRADAGRHDLGTMLSSATGLPSTTDPATTPAAHGSGLIYDTVGGSGAVTFEQQYAALFSGKVTSSTLGLISTIGLVLGFVIAVSSFLASVQERRREFGIMSSIGLADEVLYFFLVESGIVFLAAYLLGIAGAGVAVALVIPQIATVTAWAQAAGTVAAYLPAMAIVGALVPVHRLLQQRPVDLLSDS